MCYDVSSGLKKTIKYARQRGDDPAYIAALEIKLERLIKGMNKYHYVSGFAHPKLLVFTDKDPNEPQAFSWGLIPGWVKDTKTAGQLSNQTLNARGETIWEKPSFRGPAKSKRCLIYLDGFFEHHHLKGKTYPFHIAMKDESPMTVAGLWDEWVNKETGEIINSVSIVTTEANPLMTKIHNNPKAEGPRMPVILPKETQNEWLIPCTTDTDKKHLTDLLKPFDEAKLTAYSVPRLKGKEAIGNVEAATKKFEYSELDI